MTAQLLPSPDHSTRLLLHICCAPCSGGMIETLLEAGYQLTLFYYNPNIHPHQEYEIRKQESQHFAEQRHIPFVDVDYDPEHWFPKIKGLEQYPERGPRCTACFDMRLQRTASYAHEQKFTIFSSSLGISRWKNFQQVTDSGQRAASRYPNLHYWAHNWRKQGGVQRMAMVTEREQFYRQHYCGCIYSQQRVKPHEHPI